MASLQNAPNVGKEFKKAHDGVTNDPPATPVKTYELTPGGTLEQEVHTRLEEAKRSSAVDLPDDKAAKFKKHLLLRREFNKVRGQAHDQGR